VIKYYKCTSCDNLTAGPEIGGVEISCGAVIDFAFLDEEESEKQGLEPDMDKVLTLDGRALGEIRLASVAYCHGQLQEITEEESQSLVDKMSDRLNYKGAMER
jgi:hypothetical protein